MDGGSGEEVGGGIPTVLRTLLILEQVAKAGAPVTPTEVNEALGLPKPTIHRLFATLEAEGFVQKEIDGRGYAAGRRLLTMAGAVLSSRRLHVARNAILKGLSEAIGETCNLSVPDRDAMTYLDRVETTSPLRIQLRVGSQVPFHCTASGKMYLSTLSDGQLDRYLRAARLVPNTAASITDPAALRAELLSTRRRGHSEDAEEFMDGMIAIAVPIADAEGRCVATLSFHAPTIRLTLEKARAHLPKLQAAARELEREIRGEAG